MKNRILITFIVSFLSAILLVGCGQKNTNPASSNITVENIVTSSLENTVAGIFVEGEYGDAVEIASKQVSDDSDINRKILYHLADFHNVTIHQIYDIDLYDVNGYEVQPKGIITVRIQLPESLLNASGDIYKIVKVEMDDSLTEIDPNIDTTSISFETDQISIFAIVKYDSKKENIPEESDPKPEDKQQEQQQEWQQQQQQQQQQLSLIPHLNLLMF